MPHQSDLAEEEHFPLAESHKINSTLCHTERHTIWIKQVTRLQGEMWEAGQVQVHKDFSKKVPDKA